MNVERVTVTGTVLNLQTWSSSLFSMQFDVTEGRVYSASCDSTTVLSVTNFSASVADVRVGSTPIVAPRDFTAYLAAVNSGQTYQELVSDPFGLEVKGELFAPGAIVFDGNVGSWWIEGARVQISAAEPGCLSLLVLGLAAIFARLGRARPRVTTLPPCPPVALRSACAVNNSVLL
jgi:hypothetical protein